MIETNVMRTRWVGASTLQLGKTGLPCVAISDGKDFVAMPDVARIAGSDNDEARCALFAGLGAALMKFTTSNGLLLEFRGQHAETYVRLVNWLWGNPDSAPAPSRSPDTGLTLALTADRSIVAPRDGYGCVGRRFSAYISDHEQEVSRLVTELEKRYGAYEMVTAAAPFVAATMAAVLISKSTGIHGGDPKAIQFSLLSLFARVGEASGNLSFDEDFSGFWDMLIDLRGDIIVTELPTGRGTGRKNVAIEGITEPAGRAIVSDDMLYLSVSAVSEWCSTNVKNAKTLIDAAVANGWLDRPGDTKVYLGQGTTVKSSQVRCYTMRWSILKKMLG